MPLIQKTEPPYYEIDENLPTPTIQPKIYRAILNQASTAAPTTTILENTLGVTPTWSYLYPGVYLITATGLFITAKTYYSITANRGDNLGSYINFGTSYFDPPNSLAICTIDLDTGNTVNDALFDTPIEIIIYP